MGPIDVPDRAVVSAGPRPMICCPGRSESALKILSIVTRNERHKSYSRRSFNMVRWINCWNYRDRKIIPLGPGARPIKSGRAPSVVPRFGNSPPPPRPPRCPCAVSNINSEIQKRRLRPPRTLASAYEI